MTASMGVVVPIRAFRDGKSRLAPYLTADDRARLLEAMADRVLAACDTLPTAVVTSAPEVIAWATKSGATVIDDPGSLDAAARVGHDHWKGAGFGRVAVVHADLPFVDDLQQLHAPSDTAVIVPCHRTDGTPALSIPCGSGFEFAYGPGSFARHRAAAEAAGLKIREVLDVEGLRHDVDSLEDLEALAGRMP